MNKAHNTTPHTKQIPLGDQVTHSKTYNPDHLFPVPRSAAREEIGIPAELPFSGYDIWNAYEVSWVDMTGRPAVAIGEIVYPCDTPNIVESKSLKLYLNSFNQSPFDSLEQVTTIIEKDLSNCVGGTVEATLRLPSSFNTMTIEAPAGYCIDEKDIEIVTYHVDPSSLQTGNEMVERALHSNLLRTNCPVTGQPDWGTVLIDYRGKRIDEKGLLAYIVSYREHTGFHENCVERIFTDIMARCRPETLSVYARFTRRGGIDINPIRSSRPIDHHRVNLNSRLARQ